MKLSLLFPFVQVIFISEESRFFSDYLRKCQLCRVYDMSYITIIKELSGNERSESTTKFLYICNLVFSSTFLTPAMEMVALTT